MSPAARNVALLGLTLGGGYVAYRYVYVPHKIKQELLRQAALLAQQRGISQKDALSILGQGACMVLGAKYGLPPQASGPICGQAAQMVSQLVQAVPSLLTTGGSIVQAGGGLVNTTLGTAGSIIQASERLAVGAVLAPINLVKDIFKGIF